MSWCSRSRTRHPEAGILHLVTDVPDAELAAAYAQLAANLEEAGRCRIRLRVRYVDPVRPC